LVVVARAPGFITTCIGALKGSMLRTTPMPSASHLLSSNQMTETLLAFHDLVGE